MRREFIVSNENAARRLDVFLAKYLPDVSRTKIAALIDQGNVLVDGVRKKCSFRLRENSCLLIDIPEEKPFEIAPFVCSIPILFEDDEIIVVNKPQGLSTHPPHQGVNDTLVNALVYMKKKLAPMNPLRPGIVHRLDKDTSGVMIVAKTNRAYLELMNQFRRRQVKKEYRAIVWGVIDQDFKKIDLPLTRDNANRLKMKVSFVEAKNALTEVFVEKRFCDSTYAKIIIHTGRMHQIRVHMKFLGFPIVGDQKYGKKDEYALMLHSYFLGIRHPVTAEIMEFIAPVSPRFNDFMKNRK